MNTPLKRNSEILKTLRNEDLSERKRARTSVLLASLIIRALKAKKWNKLQFAEKMGKKPSVISKWLSGTHNFTSDTLTDIEGILGIKIFNCEQGDSELTIRMAASAGLTVNVFVSSKSHLVDTENFSLVTSSSLNVQVVEKNCPELN